MHDAQTVPSGKRTRRPGTGATGKEARTGTRLPLLRLPQALREDTSPAGPRLPSRAPLPPSGHHRAIKFGPVLSAPTHGGLRETEHQVIILPLGLDDDSASGTGPGPERGESSVPEVAPVCLDVRILTVEDGFVDDKDATPAQKVLPWN